ncbi:MAG: hypothetical protein ACK559_03365 [bacterium]
MPAGESRTFSMQVIGRSPGVYSFNVVSPGVTGVLQNNSITVTTADVPGPLPALGVVVAFSRSRSLRKRLRPVLGSRHV